MSIFDEVRKKYSQGLDTIITENDALKIISDENLSDIYREIDITNLTPEFLNEDELVFWHDPRNNCWCNGFTSERRSITPSEVQCENNYISALKKLIFRARIHKKHLEYVKDELKKQYGIK